MLIAFSGVERVSEEPDKLRLFCCTGGRLSNRTPIVEPLISILSADFGRCRREKLWLSPLQCMAIASVGLLRGRQRLGDGAEALGSFRVHFRFFERLFCARKRSADF